MAPPEGLFEKLVSTMSKFELQFEKLSGLTIDGGPAMVGSKKRLTTLVKKMYELSQS